MCVESSQVTFTQQFVSPVRNTRLPKHTDACTHAHADAACCSAASPPLYTRLSLSLCCCFCFKAYIAANTGFGSRAAAAPAAPAAAATSSAGETAAATTQPAIPWLKLLSRREVWALIVCHFCHNWGTFILLTWMPTYYNQVRSAQAAGCWLLACFVYVCLYTCLYICLLSCCWPLTQKKYQPHSTSTVSGAFLIVHDREPS